MSSELQSKIINGDCIEVMSGMADNSVDSIVCDPPYHLTSIVKRFGKKGSAPAKFGTDGVFARSSRGFMGKEWDGGDIAFKTDVWREALRIAKPGSFLLAFGGTRTNHRLACAIEDAGWVIKDTIYWVYGSGFPKSHNVSKAIDRKAKAKRKVVGKYQPPDGKKWNLKQAQGASSDHAPGTFTASGTRTLDITAPATDAAKKWNGWGSALKPAVEPIILAQKPIEGTILQNVMKWGCGALNIDGCRIPTNGENLAVERSGEKAIDTRKQGWGFKAVSRGNQGRWPANIIHDGSEEVVGLFPQSKGQQGDVLGAEPSHTGQNGIYGDYGRVAASPKRGNSGSASRFFKRCPFTEEEQAQRLIYCSKASRKEREMGLEELPVDTKEFGCNKAGKLTNGTTKTKNCHPCVKPISLLKYICKLVTRPGGIILDPFAGSGSTGLAAKMEGFNFIGIDMEKEYCDIAEKRIASILC